MRKKLPDTEPFRAWSNFEFIAQDGSINEVDLLVISLYKIYLVEIKSRPGRLTGDAGTWTWSQDSRVFSEDNPLLLANRKAKKLKSLLQRQGAFRKERIPFVEPVIFLSSRSLQCELTKAGRTGVHLTREAETGSYSDIVWLLSGRDTSERGGANSGAPRIVNTVSKAIQRAMEQAGIRESQRQRRVGDYILERLILETDVYQDWEAKHVSIPKSKRRVRIYPVARESSGTVRQERRRAAEREFKLLDGVAHSGILRVEQYTDHERGPSLVFEHDSNAERLDFFLQKNGRDIDVLARLSLLREIAEALDFAHSRRLYHRALSPQTVLVTANDDASRIHIKLFDWQTASSDAASRSGTRLTIEQTIQVGMSGDRQSVVYLAPEVMTGGGFDGAKTDIFSLGAIAYLIFSGEPPAHGLEDLHQKLAAGRGLCISDVLDGVADPIQELVEMATDPNVEDRPGSIGEFLKLLDQVEEDLTAPEPEDTIHPLDARKGDLLEGGFLVKRRLGKGSTSVALLVEREGREGVLKVALDTDQNTRLTKEGETLKALRHQNIVELYEQTEISGHVVLFMAKAGAESISGTYTLAERILEEGRLSLDMLQRFGDELLGVLHWLEANGVSHRDIKPDNIGVAAAKADKTLTLVLFDFSLTDTPVEDIRAGTPPYLDPFLPLRKRPRWDSYAERFAAAVTLYEMATGQIPVWGDSQSDPSMLDCEVSLDSELFDPAVREGLSQFFTKALARNYKTRFDNAEEMRRNWLRVFEFIDAPATVTDHGDAPDIEALLGSATEATPISALGLSPRILNALDRIGAHTLQELVAVPRIRLYRNKGIGQKTIKEIRELAELVAAHLAARDDRPKTTLPAPADDPGPVEPRFWSVDLLAGKLVGSRVGDQEASVIRTLLGLAPEAGLPAYAPQHSVAESLAVGRADVRQALEASRKRWLKHPWMTALRSDIAILVDKHFGIMTGAELAEAVLSARGSVADGMERNQLASAVAYAAIETEAVRDGAQFTMVRHGEDILVVATTALGEQYGAQAEARAQYAIRLAELCDALAGRDPLVAPVRVAEDISRVAAPDGDRAIPPDRLVRLGVRVSTKAALSSRMEIYPGGMSAARALKLGMGSLLGPKSLTVKQIQQRIASRYPEAEDVPGPPALNGLLTDAGIELIWNAAEHNYAPKPLRPGYLSTTSTLHRMATISKGSQTASPDAELAWVLEERIGKAIEQKRFLVLSVPPRHLVRAERELLRRFPLQRRSLESLTIDEMKKAAEQAGAKWDVVLRADSADRTSKDWRNLAMLVRRAMPAIESALLGSDSPTLLVYPGLLARYEQLDLLDRLRDGCERGNDAPGFVLLLPTDGQIDMPSVDGAALPVVLASQWARLTETWLSNAHRASGSVNNRETADG